jgi:tetratricopeptide (TPR) repeat protein
MTKSTNIDEQRFNQAVDRYQLGDWLASKEMLRALQIEYPGNERVNSLLQEIETRLSIEQQRKQEGQVAFGKRWGRTIAVISVVILAVLLIGYLAIDTYQTAELNARNAQATESTALQAQYYFEARSLLDQNQPSSALPYIDSLAALNPDHPEIEELRAEAEQQQELDLLYQEAVNKYEQQEFQATLELLEQIVAIDPDFRDVSEMLDRAGRLAVYGDLGIAGQYLIDAENILADGLTDRANLQLAQANLDSASRQGPQNNDIFRLRLEVLQSFLTSLVNFLDGDKIGTIADLEFFIENDGEFFDGMAYYMLQEAYFAQGIDAYNDGHFTEALGSFLVADQLTEDGPEAPLYAIMIKLQLAKTIADVGQYQDSAEKYIEVNSQFDLVEYFSRGSRQLNAFNSAMASYKDGDFRTAAIRFSSAFSDFFVILPKQEIAVNVEDSLINLAVQFRCPTLLLVDLNDIEPSNVYAEQEKILIPLLDE